MNEFNNPESGTEVKQPQTESPETLRATDASIEQQSNELDGLSATEQTGEVVLPKAAGAGADGAAGGNQGDGSDGDSGVDSDAGPNAGSSGEVGSKDHPPEGEVKQTEAQPEAQTPAEPTPQSQGAELDNITDIHNPEPAAASTDGPTEVSSANSQAPDLGGDEAKRGAELDGETNIYNPEPSSTSEPSGKTPETPNSQPGEINTPPANEGGTKVQDVPPAETAPAPEAAKPSGETAPPNVPESSVQGGERGNRSPESSGVTEAQPKAEQNLTEASASAVKEAPNTAPAQGGDLDYKRFEDLSSQEAGEMARNNPEAAKALNDDYQERMSAEKLGMTQEEYRDHMQRIEAANAPEDISDTGFAPAPENGVNAEQTGAPQSPEAELEKERKESKPVYSEDTPPEAYHTPGSDTPPNEAAPEPGRDNSAEPAETVKPEPVAPTSDEQGEGKAEPTNTYEVGDGEKHPAESSFNAEECGPAYDDLSDSAETEATAGIESEEKRTDEPVAESQTLEGSSYEENASKADGWDTEATDESVGSDTTGQPDEANQPDTVNADNGSMVDGSAEVSHSDSYAPKTDSVDSQRSDEPKDVSSEVVNNSPEVSTQQESIDAEYSISDKTRETLNSFEQNNWDNLSQAEKEQAVEQLRDSIAEDLQLENKPNIAYYNNEDHGDYGGYAASNNTIYINHFNMGDAAETADTVAHESRHCWQHERADNPQTEQDYQFKENFDGYVRPEDDFYEYQNQPVEADARDYARDVKDAIPVSEEASDMDAKQIYEESDHKNNSDAPPSTTGPPEKTYQKSELPADFENKNGYQPLNEQAEQKCQLAGLEKDQIQKIREIPNGQKPNPEDYLSQDTIDNHLKKFEDEGCYKVIPGEPVGTVGRGDSLFVCRGSELEQSLIEADGDPRKLEEALGTGEDYLGDNPYIVRVDNPKDLRMATGNETNAWQDYWCPGGTTIGGMDEAVVTPPSPDDYSFKPCFENGNSTSIYDENWKKH